MVETATTQQAPSMNGEPPGSPEIDPETGRPVCYGDYDDEQYPCGGCGFARDCQLRTVDLIDDEHPPERTNPNDVVGATTRAEAVRQLAHAGHLPEGIEIDPWGVSGRPAVGVDRRTEPVVPGGDLRRIKENMRLSRWRDAVTGRGDLPDPDLAPQVRHVLLTLSLWMNNNGSCAYPGTRILARACGVTTRTLRRHLRAAEAGGWLKGVRLVRETGGWSSNLYVPGCPAGTFSDEDES